jgi:hypothetical protein
MHRKVRLECVEYLRQHRQDFQDFVALPDGQSFDDYLRAMSLDICWGGQIELQALSLLYKVNFEIHSNGEIPPIDNGFKSQIMLCYSYGNHYDLVYTKKQMDYLIFCQELVVDMVAEVLNEPKSDKEFQYQNFGYDLWLNELQNMEEEDRQMAYMLNEENVNACDPEAPGFQDVKSKKKRRNENRANRQPAPMPVRTSPKPRDEVAAPPSVWGKQVNWAQKFSEPPKPKVEPPKEGEEIAENPELATEIAEDGVTGEEQQQPQVPVATENKIDVTKPAENTAAEQQANPLTQSKGMTKMSYAQILAMAKAKPVEPVKPAESTTPAPAKEAPKAQPKSNAPKGAPKKATQGHQQQSQQKREEKHVPNKQPAPKQQQEKEEKVIETAPPKKPTAPPPVWVGLQKFKEKQAAVPTPNTTAQQGQNNSEEKPAENKPQQSTQPSNTAAKSVTNGLAHAQKVQPNGVSEEHKPVVTAQPNGVQHQSEMAQLLVQMAQIVPEKINDSVKVTPVEPAPLTTITAVSKQVNGTTSATSPNQTITFGPQAAKINANLIQAQPFVPGPMAPYPHQQPMYPQQHVIQQQYGNFVPQHQGYYAPQGYYGVPAPYGQPMPYNGNPYMQGYPHPGQPHPIPPHMVPNQQYPYYQNGYPAANVPQ